MATVSLPPGGITIAAGIGRVVTVCVGAGLATGIAVKLSVVALPFPTCQLMDSSCVSVCVVSPDGRPHVSVALLLPRVRESVVDVLVTENESVNATVAFGPLPFCGDLSNVRPVTPPAWMMQPAGDSSWMYLT